MRKLHHKSQSSFEYLLIIALTFAVMIPTIYLFYNYAKHSSSEIDDSQMLKTGKAITSTSESVFYSGINSKIVLDLKVPDNVIDARIIDGKELVFTMLTPNGQSEAVFFSKVGITTNPANCNLNVCTLPALSSGGSKKIKIEAISQDYVSID